MKETMTVRVAPKTKEALDNIAARLDRDRSYIVNEAIANYLDLHRRQIEQIKKGLRQLDRGEYLSHAEVGERLTARKKKA